MQRKYSDVVDLHDDEGRVLAEKVPIEALSPLRNWAIREMVTTLKRTTLVNMKKLQTSIQTGKIGGMMALGDETQIPGRELPLDLLSKAEKIAEEVQNLIKVDPKDDTQVQLLAKGELMMIRLPSARLEVASDYSPSFLVAGNALLNAIVNVFNLGVFDGIDTIKAAIYGRYPQTKEIKGAISPFLMSPTKLEGLGMALRSISPNHLAVLAGKRAMYGAALSSILDHTAMFEMGDALGPYERYHLLGLAYQGLNANNLTLNLVKENGEGTVGTVIWSLTKRAIEDKVIRVKETLPSGYKIYTTDDPSLWNAYAASGLLASVMVNCGAMRGAQSIAATALYYNDMLSYETGLFDVDFGRVHGSAVSLSFFTHSIYGGGGPGIIAAGNVLIRHTKGFLAPCVAAAMCLDSGTQTFSPEMTSGDIAKIRDALPAVFRDPIRQVAESALKISN